MTGAGPDVLLAASSSERARLEAALADAAARCRAAEERVAATEASIRAEMGGLVVTAQQQIAELEEAHHRAVAAVLTEALRLADELLAAADEGRSLPDVDLRCTRT